MEAKLNSTDRPVAIYYIFQSNLTSFSKSGNSFCSLIFTGEWNPINTTIGTLNINEPPPTRDNAGMIHTTEISGLVPGHDDDTPEDIAGISGKKVIIKIDYKSGKTKIIGNNIFAPRIFIGVESNTNTERKISSVFKNTEPNYWLE